MKVKELLSWFASNYPDAVGDSEPGQERARIYDLFAKRFGGRLLERCRPDELQAWIESHVVNAWTRQNWRKTLHLVASAAVVEGLVAINPLAPIHFPPGERRATWSDEVYRTLLRNAPANVRRLIVFARRSGARPGMIRSLQLSDVQIGDDGIKISGIALDDVLVKLLGWLLRNAPEESQWLFLNSRGGQWSRWAIVQRFADIRKAAGLPDTVKLDGARPGYVERQLAKLPLLFPLSQGQGRTWTSAEFNAMLRHSRPALRRVLVFCRFSGLRPQDVRKLTWDCLTVADDGVMVAKIGRRSRRLATDSVTIKLALWLGRKQRHQKKPYLFLKTCGGAWSPHTLYGAFVFARDKAGLTDEIKICGCRPLA